ncbi:hypothetical protein J6590_065819 [Homalodisca vitripennis]|nr:hypothetical protein J6590_065819 [Homalodisca vitripennis]
MKLTPGYIAPGQWPRVGNGLTPRQVASVVCGREVAAIFDTNWAAQNECSSDTDEGRRGLSWRLLRGVKTIVLANSDCD